MLCDVLIALILLAALGSGLVAGIFFAFSTFVMTALGRLPPEHGIAAMQAINVAIREESMRYLFSIKPDDRDAAVEVASKRSGAHLDACLGTKVRPIDMPDHPAA